MVKALVLSWCILSILNPAIAQQLGIEIDRTFDGKSSLVGFTYRAPANIQPGTQDRVYLLYTPYRFNRVPLEPSGNGYRFAAQIPDSVHFAIAVIFNRNRQVLDDNGGIGYTLSLKGDTGQETPLDQLELLQLRFFASRAINLKTDMVKLIVDFEILFEKHPEVKSDEVYLDYLIAKGQVDPEGSKALMKSFATQMENRGDEPSLRMAHIAYRILKDQDKMKEMQSRSVEQFPKGNMAKGVFFEAFYEAGYTDEADILKELDAFRVSFGEPKEDDLPTFYLPIIRNAMMDKDWAKLEKYEALLPDPLGATNIYNNHAWELSGQDLTSEGEDLDYAEKLSSRTLVMTSKRIAKPRPEDDPGNLKSNYNLYADTYALILYKMGRYEDAYRYQSEVEKQGELDLGGRERYAGMVMKVKGPDFTRAYLEHELSSGSYSPQMLRQLKGLYQQQGWPLAQYELLREKTEALGREKARKAVMDMLGTEEAIDFSLTDRDGKKVQLANYKGKTVVIDFWATWCGPCLASFPKMQELVKKYEGRDVAFLFINTWEDDKPQVVRQKVDKLLKDKQYSFYVLYDYEDKVVTQYKVEGIPTKIVIDSTGKVLSVDSSDEGIEALIDSLVR